MNMLLKLILCVFLFGLGLTRRVSAEEMSAGTPVRCVVGLSPYLENAVKDDIYRRIIGMLIEDLPLNSSLAIYDAYNLQTIAEADIPGARAFKSAKTRANQFGEPIRALKQFLAAAHSPPKAEEKVSFKEAIRFPQFMDFVAELPNDTNRKTVVILLGSPLYVDHKEPGFSMVDGYFPSDGHLTASRDKTVFGLKEREGILKGMAIYFGYFGDPWVSALHKKKVERFWSLFLQGEGARLGAFSGDLPTVFKAARLGHDAVGTGARFALDRGQTKVEMLRISRDIGMADWITQENVSNAGLKPPTSLNGPMKIGIRWKGNIDLDLYARPRPGAERLYFEKVRSAEGYYFKDHRSSPEREYEFIEFERPVNISEVQTEINFFEGRAPGGPKGEIRIEFEGRIYSGHFRIPADHGNEGREGNRQNSFWSPIDVPSILGIKKENVQARVR